MVYTNTCQLRVRILVIRPFKLLVETIGGTNQV